MKNIEPKRTLKARIFHGIAKGVVGAALVPFAAIAAFYGWLRKKRGGVGCIA